MHVNRCSWESSHKLLVCSVVWLNDDLFNVLYIFVCSVFHNERDVSFMRLLSMVTGLFKQNNLSISWHISFIIISPILQTVNTSTSLGRINLLVLAWFFQIINQSCFVM